MVTNEFKIFLECCILAQETSGSKIKFSFFSFSFGYSLRLVFILMKMDGKARHIHALFGGEEFFHESSCHGRRRGDKTQAPDL